MKLGWVDFSPEARRAADAALNAVRDPGALDELGIGAVRDAFANVFFPGTSTLQTKPKYFVIIPRALRITLERITQGKVTDSASNELWRQEYRCADSLWQSVGQKIGSGVIGGTRLGHGWRNWIAGPPSTIYWSGLRTFEIIDAEEGDSLRSFLEARATLARRGVGRSNRIKGDEDEGIADADETRRELWRTGINMPSEIFKEDTSKADWTEGLSMNLTPPEASWLRERILDSQASCDSLLAICLQNGMRIPKISGQFTELKSPFEMFCMSVQRRINANKQLQSLMDLACAFARLVLVGRVLYNRILGKESAEELWRMIKPNVRDYIGVDLSAVFGRSDLKLARQGGTYRFLCDFQNKLRRHQWDAAKKAICEREINIKGRARAKLLHPDSRKTQERDWIGGLWLDYRLSSAREIVEGIRQAIKEGHDA